MDIIEPLSDSTRLLYAQLLESMDQPPPVSPDLRFIKKNVGNKPYWIRRVQIGETSREVSLGPATTAVTRLIETQKAQKADAEKETADREKLVLQLIAGGAAPMDPIFTRILLLLVNARIFERGGILIGSHAFLAYGNMLGYRFKTAVTRTADIDLAFDDTLSIAVENKTELGKAIEGAGLDLLAVPGLDPRSKSTSYKMRGREYRVDLLTNLEGKPSSKPRYVPSIKSYAAPLRYLDYLFTETIDTMIVAGPGIKVRVPAPGRFAIHKLMLAGRRPVTQQVKSQKDVTQAACLIKILSQDRPSDLLAAIEAAKSYGQSRKFMQCVVAGYQQLIARKEWQKDSDMQLFGKRIADYNGSTGNTLPPP